MRQIAATLVAYVGGQLLIALILTIIYAVAFALIRLPLWFLLAPLCGFLHLVPHFGPVVALIVGFLDALIGEIGWARFAVLVGIYVGAFTFEGYFLSPWILGRRLRLRPLYVFLAVLAGGTVFGFVGLLLAVPVLAVAMAVYRFFAKPGEAQRAR